MKNIILPVIAIFLTFAASAQNDTLKVRPVKPGDTKSQPIRVKAANDQLARINAVLQKIELNFEALDKEIQRLNDMKDSLSELSEEQQLKMQMIMDRMTRADAAASNMLKKYSEIASQIISNWK